MLALLLACAAPTPKDTGAGDTAPGDTATDSAGDTGETGDTSPDSGETDDTSPDSGETDDTGETGDTGDTACGTWTDADGDGYGDPASPSCDADAVADATDCDDADPYRYPGAMERCDGGPNDCDAWTEADEVGIVTAWTAAGEPVDMSGGWRDGTPDAPADIGLDQPRYTVCPGTWYVRLTIAADATVVGVYGAAVTTLDGAGGRVARADGPLTLSGVTLTGGDAAGEDGGGLLHLAGDLALTDVAFVGNVGSLGGALSIQHGAHDAGAVTLDAVSFDGNAADVGGGLHVDIPGPLTVTGGAFTANEAGEAGGGGFVVSSTDVRFERVDLADNVAGGAGGGLYVDVPAPIRLTDLTATGNTAGGEGGGLWLSGPDVLELATLTLDTNAAGAAGGGIAAFVDSIRGDTVSIAACTAEGDGGGLYAVANGVQLGGLSVDGSRAAGNGGGAALLVSSLASLEGSALTTNEAASGGGVWIDGGGDASVVAALTTVDVAENHADDGAGLLLAVGSTTLTGVSLRANEATGDGGGAWAAGIVDAGAGTTFNDGRATRGGGLWLDQGTFTCTGSAGTDEGFRRNLAEVGGGVAIGETASLASIECDFGDGKDDNVATDLGADVFLAAFETAWSYGDDATFTCVGAVCL